MTVSEIENATLEAIFWWNRTESFYHKSFSRMDILYQDKDLLNFFIRKIFEVFLREYAVRRNLLSGNESTNSFINELFENDFFQNVKNGNIEIIDTLSIKLKENGKSTVRNTKSLLSKVAFLINPHEFSLYDSLAKSSIWEINKENSKLKRTELESYSVFKDQTDILRENLVKKDLFKTSHSLLLKFPKTESFEFFSKHKDAFELRIVDKFLWIYNQTLNGKEFKNHSYIKFYKKFNVC